MNGPVIVGIELYQEGVSSQSSKTGAIALPRKGSQLVGGHAIVLVAYEERKKTIQVRQ
jgi:hypothetical protein